MWRFCCALVLPPQALLSLLQIRMMHNTPWNVQQKCDFLIFFSAVISKDEKYNSSSTISGSVRKRNDQLSHFVVILCLC
jgi:hypothetical protein